MSNSNVSPILSQAKRLTKNQKENIDLFLTVYPHLTSDSVRTAFDMKTQRYSVYLWVVTESGFGFEAPLNSYLKTDRAAAFKATAVREYMDAYRDGAK